ncbi:hypothetical protein [Alkalihalobacillus sp. 1P02AB]|uniref:capsular polysaccharide export protein, LipB/KpsS family n=1 Tax=Alkalihalobacillus sp. 1P02AB TaxID=3132260 RepID=UPI0039A48AB8
MANYLFLRGNRNKRFFSDIAAELIQKGNQCFLMKFELGELLFKSEIETKYMPFYVSKKEYPITDEELLEMPLFNLTYKESILKKSVKKSELRMYKRYLFAMDHYIKEKKIDTICTFNGYHWLDQMAQLLARKYGLQMHYFEEGLFRPYTITHDLNGINAEASIPRHPGFYQNIEVDQNRLNHYLFQPENPSLKEALGGQILKVAFVKLVSMFGSFCRLNPKLYDHINFWQALNYFATKVVFKYKKEDTFEWPTEYVFLPFQMVGDTQILYNSPHIKTMEKLLKRTVKAVTQINREEKRNIKIIVKEHPEDLSQQLFPIKEAI